MTAGFTDTGQLGVDAAKVKPGPKTRPKDRHQIRQAPDRRCGSHPMAASVFAGMESPVGASKNVLIQFTPQSLC